MDFISEIFSFAITAVSERDPIAFLLPAIAGLVTLLVKAYSDNRTLTRQAKASEDVVNGLRAQLQMASGERDQCRFDLQMRTDSYDSVTRALTSARETAERDAAHIARLEHDLSYQKSRVESYERLARAHELEVGRLLDESLTLTQEAQELRFKNASLLTEVDHNRHQVVELRTRLSASGDELRQRVGELLDEKSRLMSEFDKLSAERDALTSELRREQTLRRTAQAEADRANPDAMANLEQEVRQLRLRVQSGGSDPIDRLLEEIGSDGAGQDIWTRHPILRPSGYVERLQSSKPIMMIGNLKGGVGKTTLAANLAGHYHRRDERVLLIDLDYQGSLSAMTVSAERKLHAPQVRNLFRGNPVEPYPMKAADGSAVVDCYYDFAELETVLMLEWLAERSQGRDVRFLLAQYLLSDEIQNRYDRIILDTAPRVSTAFVNAFCAATHLIIPTRLDVLSAETVDSFLRRKGELMQLRSRAGTITRMRTDPAALPFQVVGTMKRLGTDALSAGESDAIARIHEALDRDETSRDALIKDAFIPSRAGFAREAGYGIAYFTDPEVRVFIDRLVERIEPYAPTKWSLAA